MVVLVLAAAVAEVAKELLLLCATPSGTLQFPSVEEADGPLLVVTAADVEEGASLPGI